MFMCTENMPEHQGPKCKARIKETNFIKALKLANTSISPEYTIDMLIGSDIYWNYVTGETKHSPGENLVVVTQFLAGSLVDLLNVVNKRMIKLSL